MSAALAVVVAIYVLAVMTGTLPARWSGARAFRLSRHETIRFVDGPLAGSTAQQRTSSDGLPALQITPRIPLRDNLSIYTLPYERRLLCDDCHHWHYTEGWTNENVAQADITEWGKAA